MDDTLASFNAHLSGVKFCKEKNKLSTAVVESLFGNIRIVPLGEAAVPGVGAAQIQCCGRGQGGA